MYRIAPPRPSSRQARLGRPRLRAVPPTSNVGGVTITYDKPSRLLKTVRREVVERFLSTHIGRSGPRAVLGVRMRTVLVLCLLFVSSPTVRVGEGDSANRPIHKNCYVLCCDVARHLRTSLLWDEPDVGGIDPEIFADHGVAALDEMVDQQLADGWVRFDRDERGFVLGQIEPGQSHRFR